MAKPKLALIPASQGSKLFSVLPSSGVGDFDFSRSGKATRINSQGLIEEVDDGVSRLNYPMIDGKVVGCPHHILEGARTNLITNSEDLSSGFLNENTSELLNVIISPDGTLNADKLVENNTNGRHELYSGTISFSGTTSISFFAKAEERRYISVFFGGNPGNGGATFDVEDGVVSLTSGGTDASIVNYGNGWYRCSLTSTVAATNRIYYCLRTDASAVSVQVYQGDGTSGMYLWGFQTEVGQSYPTSYIPTNGEANGVTRAAEVANGSGDAATFNDSEGVLMVEMASLVNTNLAYNSFSIGSGTNNVLSVGFTATTNKLYAYKTDGSSAWLTEILVGDITSFNKFALRYNQNENEFWINGFKLATNNTIGVNPNTLSDMDFNAAFGGEFMYSKTKEVQYYNSELVDSELEQLTSWTSFTDMANGQLYTIE